MPKYYVFLVLTVLLSTGATYAASASGQFSRAVPTLLFVVLMGAAYYMFGVTAKYLPLSLIYAVWSGLGIVLVAVIGRVFLNEQVDFAMIIGITLIIAGIIVMNLFSGKDVAEAAV